jgi:glutaredoxin-like protein NrdH
MLEMLAEFAAFFNMAGGGILPPKEAPMLETLGYTAVEGTSDDREITVYALSTCGFCKRALAFLDSRGLAYRYVYVDKIPLETKNAAKRELKARFGDDVAFPFAVIDGTEHLVGFIEAAWASALEK